MQKLLRSLVQLTSRHPLSGPSHVFGNGIDLLSMQRREILLIVILPRADLKVVPGDLLRDQASSLLRVRLRAAKAVLHLVQVNARDMLRFAMVFEDPVPEDSHFAAERYLFRVGGFDVQFARLLQYLLGN